MRTRAALAPVAAAVLAVGLLRCSLLVDTDGLAGVRPDGAPAVTSDASDPPDATDAATCLGAVVATDPANCGRCGHDCQGGSCTGGVCQPVSLVANSGKLGYIRVDATHVYFVDRKAGSVQRVPKRGGAVESIATAQPPLYQLAVDATHVYFTAGTGVSRVPKAGGAVEPIAVQGGDELMLDDGAVYSSTYTLDDTGAVGRASKDGTNAVVLVPNLRQCESIVPSGDAVFIGGAKILRYVKATASVTTLANVYARRLAADPTHVYAIGYDGLDVTRIDRASGATNVLATSPAMPRASDIAVDDTHVYWATGVASGFVVRVPKVGGAVEIIASQIDVPWGIAVDDDAVYWSTVGGTITKRAK